MHSTNICKSRHHHLSAYKRLPIEDLWTSNTCCRALKCYVYWYSLLSVLQVCATSLFFYGNDSQFKLFMQSKCLLHAWQQLWKPRKPIRHRAMPLVSVEASWNVMAHVQKPDFVFRRNGRVHLNRWGASVQSTTVSRGVHISGSNTGYTMFRGSVKGTGYPLHSPVSLSLPLSCVTACHHISTGVYHNTWLGVWVLLPAFHSHYLFAST